MIKKISCQECIDICTSMNDVEVIFHKIEKILLHKYKLRIEKCNNINNVVFIKNSSDDRYYLPIIKNDRNISDIYSYILVSIMEVGAVEFLTLNQFANNPDSL